MFMLPVWPILYWRIFVVGLKFYKDRYLRHPIVEFGHSPEQTPTYRRRPKWVQVLFIGGAFAVVALAVLDAFLKLHR